MNSWLRDGITWWPWPFPVKCVIYLLFYQVKDYIKKSKEHDAGKRGSASQGRGGHEVTGMTLRRCRCVIWVRFSFSRRETRCRQRIWRLTQDKTQRVKREMDFSEVSFSIYVAFVSTLSMACVNTLRDGWIWKSERRLWYFMMGTEVANYLKSGEYKNKNRNRGILWSGLRQRPAI